MASPGSDELRGAAVARRAYETVEPFHVLAYFSPGIGEAAAELGVDAPTFYVGGRAGPMGEANAAVVTAAFYNFAAPTVQSSWQAARKAGLAEIGDGRYAALGRLFAQILADVDADLQALADGFGELIETLPLSGRALASAWAATDVPDEPALALWRNVAVLREWRGDNHIAELIRHGLSGLEAGVLHEAQLLDPTVKRRALGRRFFQLSRGWTDEDWDAAAGRLAERGLLEVVEQGERLTPEGMTVFTDIEAGTDAVSGQVFDAASAELVERFRPVSKAVIDAGILPGTKRS